MNTALAPTSGSNLPDYAADEERRLKREFEDIQNDVAKILAEARQLPAAVEDEATAELYTSVMTRFKDLDGRIEALRVSEGLPHLRKTEAVNSFFFGMRERLARRKKTDPAGGYDVLQSRLHAYNVKREEEERARRQEEERRERERLQKIEDERIAREREAREAEERAARARKAENKEAAEAAQREAERAAERLRQEEENQRSRTAEAAAAAAAKPADLVRERHGKAMNTMKRVGFAEIIDASQLDPVKLWPFVKLDAKQAALTAWAKTTQHTQQMEGAEIGFRNETVVKR